MKKPIRTTKLRLLSDTVKTLDRPELTRIAGAEPTVLTFFTLRCTE